VFPPIAKPKQKIRASRARLTECFDRLPDASREHLLAFAEFLLQRDGPRPDETAPTPNQIPRPAEESVIAAVRRLSQTYHMLDKGQMLHETSSLVTAHVVQGRPAPEVIDELQTLFESRYREHLGKPGG